MKYEDFKYKRPDLLNIEKKLYLYLDKFSKACSPLLQENILHKIYKLFENFESMKSLAFLRNAQDITNEFYLCESKFFDNNFPKFNNLKREVFSELIKSKYKKELQKSFGRQLFKIAYGSLKTHNSNIEEELKIENQLIRKYESILSTAMIPTKKGKKILSEIQPFMESANRNIRKEAYHSFYNYFLNYEKEFDQIFDKLIKVRDKISKKLGFRDYVEYCNIGDHRSYFGSERTKNFRDNIIEHFVPILKTIKAKKTENLKLSELKVYDSVIGFKTGNPKPVGNNKLLFENFRTMYKEFSPETGFFFNTLLENNLIDYYSRKNKDASVFCTDIYDYKSPFMFLNSNGTHTDISSFIHEFGHAYQFHCCKDFKIKDYIIPSAEMVELPSVCLEFLTLPWMNLFFNKENTEKYVYNFICTSIKSIVHQVMGDEFQNYIYKNPDIGINERKNKWKELNMLYFDYVDYDGILYLERGSGWHLIGHFFFSPLFYIDYAIATICGIRFWMNSKQNNKQNVENYITLCKAGGSVSFKELIRLAGLHTTFEEESIKNSAKYITNFINGFDNF